MNTYTRLTDSDFATEREDSILSRYEISQSDDGALRVYDADLMSKELRYVVISEDGFELEKIPAVTRDEFLTDIRLQFERICENHKFKTLAKISALRKSGFKIRFER